MDVVATESTTSSDLESSLRSVLLRMASLLVASGYSYNRANALLKQSFVSAAADIDRDVGRKVNIARIAAVTGLTRIEVSKLIGASKWAADTRRSQNRASRVAEGWVSDRQFLDEKGRPRQLTFSGNRSFSVLAKRYSGDIPARAILREMFRLGLVRQEQSGSIRLVRTYAKTPQKTIKAMRAISPWVDSLWTHVRKNDGSDLHSKVHQLKLRFDSLPQVAATLREFEARKNAFIRSIAELNVSPVKVGRHQVRFTIAVAASKPVFTQRKRPPRKGSRHGNQRS
jgi:hypothetical protein